MKDEIRLGFLDGCRDLGLIAHVAVLVFEAAGEAELLEQRGHLRRQRVAMHARAELQQPFRQPRALEARVPR